MKVISCRVIPVAGYVMNVCNLGKGERQSSDERLYSKRSKGGRGFKSFKEVYDETKTRVACYMAAAKSEWIRISWGNESQKKQISLKKETEKEIRKIEVTV